jgi:lipopolysaccharide/colanic/teichoic acid biosynthesis glycosyltransferase
MMKRTMDIIVACLGLILFLPVLVVVALLVRLDSRGPVFFRQERMGKGFRPFLIWKFRTMVRDAAHQGGAITFGRDPRITRVGRVLRLTKLDELPQLINVLQGQMSLVGPRPEVPQYVQMFRQDYAEILKVRPGITDLGSLKYRNESDLLGRSSDPRQVYISEILPDKIRLAKEYLRRSSIAFDLLLILKTLFRLVT